MQNLLPPIESPDNFFHDGNPLTGELGTIVTALFMNNVQSAIRNAQAEIIAIMTDAGIAADAGKSDQLLAALKKTFALNASPALTGNPTAPTQPKADNSTKLATTAHVKLVAADYAPLANPVLTGTPIAPTAAQTVNNTQIATTAFVKAAVAALVDSSPGALDTLNELAAALGDDPNFAATMNAALAAKAPLASPALTGAPTAPTAAAGTNTAQIATTAFVAALAATKASLASPVFTGVPTAPTAAAGTNTTQIATTAFVTALTALKADLASPALTGTPTAPTAATATSNTQIATTAFVKAAIASLVDSAPGALDTLNELAAAIGNDPNFAATMTNLIAGKAGLASPSFTGTPTAPTAAAATSNTQIATTAHVKAAIATGTAAAAGKLATARKINGVSFDGTTDIDINLGLSIKALGQYGTLSMTAVAFTALNANTLRGSVVTSELGMFIKLNETKLALCSATPSEVITSGLNRYPFMGAFVITGLTRSGQNNTVVTVDITYPNHGVTVGTARNFLTQAFVYREIGCSIQGMVADSDGFVRVNVIRLSSPASSLIAPIMTSSMQDSGSDFGVLPVAVFGRTTQGYENRGTVPSAYLSDLNTILMSCADKSANASDPTPLVNLMLFDFA